MLAICFWFRIISIAAQRCWIAFVSACRLFVRRAMTCVPAQLQIIKLKKKKLTKKYKINYIKYDYKEKRIAA